MKNEHSRPRILITGKAYEPHIGGVETSMRQTAQALKAHGAKVLVLACHDRFGKRTEKTRVHGIAVRRCGILCTLFSCPVSLSYLRYFRKYARQADCIEIHMPFPYASLALMLSGFRGKVVLHWHSDIVRQKFLLKLYEPFQLHTLRRADLILAATPAHIEHSPMLRRFRDKCAVVPYGIDAAEYTQTDARGFLEKRLTRKGAVKILFAGRLVYYKGADVLLEAFAKAQILCKRPMELFFAGSGALEGKLRAQAKEQRLTDSVHFLGRLPENSLKACFADCDFLVLPSVAKSEAFGLVQLEAMACGKPVINTSLPTGVPLVSLNGRTGLTVPPSDADALADAIVTLAEDDELREKFSKAARKRVREEFDEKTVAERLCALITEDL